MGEYNASVLGRLSRPYNQVALIQALEDYGLRDINILSSPVEGGSVIQTSSKLSDTQKGEVVAWLSSIKWAAKIGIEWAAKMGIECVTERSYEECWTCPMALSSSALAAAFGKVAESFPTLVVNPENSDNAALVMQSYPRYLNLKEDPNLNLTEWYIESNGKRVGSVGC